MIKNTIAGKLQSLPIGHSDRLMSLRLPIQDNKFATIISVYAPTLQADPGTKEAFYHDLGMLIKAADRRDKLLIMGDFNARVGREHDLCKGVIGRHGIGNCNDNERMLLELCSEHNLTITNTLFQQKARYKTTWRHPRSKHWHMLDYILHTRVMPSADCYTDHRLVRAKVNLRIKVTPIKKGTHPKKLQVERLHLLKEEFQAKLKRKLEVQD